MEDEYEVLSRTDFAAQIKGQYPEYADYDDEEVVTAVLEKYPEYNKVVEGGTDTSETSFVPVENDLQGRILSKEAQSIDDQLNQSNPENFVQKGVASRMKRFEKYDNIRFRSEAQKRRILGADYHEYNTYLQTGQINPNSGDLIQGQRIARTEIMDDIMEDLPEARRVELKKELYDNEVTEEEEKNVRTEFEKKMKDYDDTYESLLLERKALREEGEDLTDVNKKITSLFKNRNYDAKDYANFADEQERENIALDFIKRSYLASDKFNAAWQGAGLALGKAGTDFMQLLNYGSHNAVYWDEVEDNLIESAKELENYRMNNLEYPMTFDEIDSIEDFGEWVGETVINQSPFLAFAAASFIPGVGPALANTLFFASGAGEKSLDIGMKDKKYTSAYIKDLVEQRNNAEWGSDEYSELNKQIGEAQRFRSISQTAKVMSILGYGGAELLFERIGTLGLLNDFRFLAKGLPANASRLQKLRVGLHNRLGTPAALGIGGVSEAVTEAMTTIGQNWIDVTLLEDNKSIIEGVDESAAAGALLGVLLGGAGGLHTKVSHRIRDQREQQQLDKYKDEVNEILPQIVAYEDGSTKSDLSKADYDSLMKRWNDIKSEVKTLENVDKKRLAAMPGETIKLLFQTDANIRLLNKDISRLQNKQEKARKQQEKARESLGDQAGESQDTRLDVNDAKSLETKLQQREALEKHASELLSGTLNPKQERVLKTLKKSSNQDIFDLKKHLELRAGILSTSSATIGQSLSKKGESASATLLEEQAYYEGEISDTLQALEKVDSEIAKREEAKQQNVDAVEAQLKAEGKAGKTTPKTETKKAPETKETTETKKDEATEIAEARIKDIKKEVTDLTKKQKKLEEGTKEHKENIKEIEKLNKEQARLENKLKPKEKGVIGKAIDKVVDTIAGTKKKEKAAAEQKEELDIAHAEEGKAQEAAGRIADAAKSLEIDDRPRAVGGPTALKDKTNQADKESSYGRTKQSNTKAKRANTVATNAEKRAAKAQKTGAGIDAANAKAEKAKANAEKANEQAKQDNAIAEASVDLNNASYEANDANLQAAVEQIGENTTADNASDVQQTIIDNTSYENNLPGIFVIILNKAIARPGISEKDIAALKKKFSTDAALEADINRVQEVRDATEEFNSPVDYIEYDAATSLLSVYRAIKSDRFHKRNAALLKNGKTQRTMYSKDAPDIAVVTKDDIDTFNRDIREKVVLLLNNTWNNKNNPALYTLHLAYKNGDFTFEDIVDDLYDWFKGARGAGRNTIDKALGSKLLSLISKETREQAAEISKKVSRSIIMTPRPTGEDLKRTKRLDRNKNDDGNYDIYVDSDAKKKWDEASVTMGGYFASRAFADVGGNFIPDYGYPRKSKKPTKVPKTNNKGETKQINRFNPLPLNDGHITLNKDVPGSDAETSKIIDAVNKVKGAKAEKIEDSGWLQGQKNKWLDPSDAVYSYTITDPIAFDRDFKLEGYTETGYDLMSKLMWRADFNQQLGTQPLRVVRDRALSEIATYRVRDAQKYQSHLRGFEITRGDELFHENPVQVRNGKNVTNKTSKPQKGRPVMTNQPQDTTISPEMNEVVNVQNTMDYKMPSELVGFVMEAYRDGEFDALNQGYDVESTIDNIDQGTAVSLHFAAKHADKKFNIQHFLDWRTRLYSGNHLVNPQGVKHMLALYRMDKPYKLDWSAYEDILIQAADQFNPTDSQGRKLMYRADRVNWALNNMDKLMAFAQDYKSKIGSEIYKNADEKFLLFNTARALLDIQEELGRGKDITEIETDLHVHADHTVSGGQHYAMMSGDRYTAALVNLMTNSMRRDLYIKVAEKVFNTITEIDSYDDATKTELFQPVADRFNTLFGKYETDVRNQEDWKKEIEGLVKPPKDPKKWTDEQIHLDEVFQLFWGHKDKHAEMRTLSKSPVMTKFYNAGAWVMMENVIPSLNKKGAFKDMHDGAEFGYTAHTDVDNDLDIDRIDGFRRAAVLWLTNKLSKATEEIAVGPTKAKTFLTRLNKSIRAANAETEDYQLTPAFTGLGNKQVVKQLYTRPYWGSGSKQDVSLSGTTPLTARGPAQNTYTITNEWTSDPIQDETGWSPNVVHGYGDAQTISMLVLAAKQLGLNLILIHDSIGVQATKVKMVKRMVRNFMADMYETRTVPKTDDHGAIIEGAPKDTQTGMDRTIINMIRTSRPDLIGKTDKNGNSLMEAEQKYWRKIWKDDYYTPHVLGREMTPEMKAILGTEQNTMPDWRKELQHAVFAIDGAGGMGMMESMINQETGERDVQHDKFVNAVTAQMEGEQLAKNQAESEKDINDCKK